MSREHPSQWADEDLHRYVVVPTQVLEALAALRAAFIVYRNAHWQVRGPNYYGNHLLFQRLYEETQLQVDRLAEQIVGTWGSEALGGEGDVEIVERWVSEMSRGQDPLKNSLEAATTSRDMLSKAYDALKESGQMTIGWDDLLMALASEKDQHVYLLQQASYPTSTLKLKKKLLR